MGAGESKRAETAAAAPAAGTRVKVTIEGMETAMPGVVLPVPAATEGLVAVRIDGFGRHEAPASALRPMEGWYDPTAAWQQLVDSGEQTREPVELPAADSAQPAGTVRVVMISDTHGKHRECTLPPGDVLLHAGDFTNVGEPSQVADFAAWMGEQPHAHKVCIAGNHDITLHESFYERAWQRFHRAGKEDAAAVKAAFEAACAANGVTYLEDSEATVAGGLRVFGSPWQPEFYDWAFNLERGAECQEAWARIPAGVDIVLVHGPPLGHGDMCSSGERAGCLHLLRDLQTRVRPRLVVAGHIHEDRGATTDGRGTTYVNASTCDLRYRTREEAALVVDIPVDP